MASVALELVLSVMIDVGVAYSCTLKYLHGVDKPVRVAPEERTIVYDCSKLTCCNLMDCRCSDNTRLYCTSLVGKNDTENGAMVDMTNVELVVLQVLFFNPRATPSRILKSG